MTNIKETLIEKERLAWIDGKIRAAEFYDDILQYIIGLEEEINLKDRELGELHCQIHAAKAAANGIDA